MATNLVLSKDSSESEIKAYFNAVLKLSQSNNEFPINLDEVWMLVYQKKVKRCVHSKKTLLKELIITPLPKMAKLKKGFLPKMAKTQKVLIIKFYAEMRKTQMEADLQMSINLQFPAWNSLSLARSDRCLRFIAKYFTKASGK